MAQLFCSNLGWVCLVKKLKFSALFLLALPCLVFAQSYNPREQELHPNNEPFLKFEDETFPELITAPRAQATGNAFLTRSDDTSAPFYNPAGLGSVRWVRVHPVSAYGESNYGLTTARTEEWGNDPYENSKQSLTFEGLRRIARENRGAVLTNRSQANPNITLKYISGGYFYSRRTMAWLSTRGELDDPLTKMYVAFREDHGAYGAISIPLFSGIVKFGAAVFRVNRKEIFGKISVDQRITQVQEHLVKLGSTTIINAGGRLTLPFKFLPSIAATMHNTSDNNFKEAHGDDKWGERFKPAPIRQQLDLGASLSPQVGKRVRFHFEFNFKDAAKKHDVDADRRMIGGIEMDVARVFYLRAGYGHRNFTGGIGVKTRFLELELATYGVDVDTPDQINYSDRRFSGMIAMGF